MHIYTNRYLEGTNYNNITLSITSNKNTIVETLATSKRFHYQRDISESYHILNRTADYFTSQLRIPGKISPSTVAVRNGNQTED